MRILIVVYVLLLSCFPAQPQALINFPPYSRQVTQSPVTVSTVDGSASWTYPTPFNNMPTCWPSLQATTTSYTFDMVVETSRSVTSVSYAVTAHLKLISIASLGVQALSSPPPAGTTLTISCLAAP